MEKDAQKDILLQVKNLKTHFYTEDGLVKAVDGVDFTVRKGEVVGLVGESGCGKSVTSFSIMGLIAPPGKVVSGEILFDGQDLLKMSETEMDNLRGRRISMIFQQPQSSLNPVFTTGDQVGEVMEIHTHEKRASILQRTLELFHQVGIPDYEKKIKAYPHEMSGGQAQRVMIAMALAMKPAILIADEPTTALDVTIQAQILNLIQEMRAELDTAVILITHDLGVVAEMADWVAVMYAGVIVEQASVQHLFKRPLHPYTQGLLRSVPVMGRKEKKLEVIPGTVPNLVDLPAGCRFAGRCTRKLEYALTICDQQEPPMQAASDGQTVRCWLYQTTAGHAAPLTLPARAETGTTPGGSL